MCAAAGVNAAASTAHKGKCPNVHTITNGGIKCIVESQAAAMPMPEILNTCFMSCLKQERK